MFYILIHVFSTTSYFSHHSLYTETLFFDILRYLIVLIVVLSKLNGLQFSLVIMGTRALSKYFDQKPFSIYFF